MKRDMDRVPVADRLERTIEDRTNVEVEIERAQREQPSRPSLRRTVFWLALTATLALAGVSPGDAVLATFAYRLFSYWLLLPLGLLGAVLHSAGRARALTLRQPPEPHH